MGTARFRLTSSVGKKLLNGATGAFLLAFIVAHLAGNLTIFLGQDAINTYASLTHSLGWLLIAIELGLGAVFVLHAVSAIAVWRESRVARTSRYAVVASKGASSKQTIASRSMVVTGIVLLVFLVIHLWQMRFGPHYVAELNGEQVWDLWRVVIEVLKQPVWVAFYVGVMLLLGFHLRHGFWSAFQTLGALGPGLRPLAFSAGLAFAIVIAAGFVALPIYVYLFVPWPPPSGVALVQP
jgi:succinate dehydrogenase / fumarate reductase cytochrome b subunit